LAFHAADRHEYLGSRDIAQRLELPVIVSLASFGSIADPLSTIREQCMCEFVGNGVSQAARGPHGVVLDEQSVLPDGDRVRASGISARGETAMPLISANLNGS